MLAPIFVMTALFVSAPEEAKEQAKKLVDGGNNAFASEDYQAALAYYERAYQLYPSPKILVNLGETHRALEQWTQAVLHYERFLREAPDEGEMVAKVKARIADLNEKIGRLAIVADGAVAVDGTPVEAKSVAVEPGPHHVVVKREGYRDFAKIVPVSAGETATVAVTMEAMEPPPEPITTKWWFWAGSGAVAIAVVGLVLGIALNTGGDDFVPAGELSRMRTADWERF